VAVCAALELFGVLQYLYFCVSICTFVPARHRALWRTAPRSSGWCQYLYFCTSKRQYLYFCVSICTFVPARHRALWRTAPRSSCWCQYLYFCTSKASYYKSTNAGTFASFVGLQLPKKCLPSLALCASGVSTCTFVLVKQVK
jgi:hypothetical protein